MLKAIIYGLAAPFRNPRGWRRETAKRVRNPERPASGKRLELTPELVRGLLEEAAVRLTLEEDYKAASLALLASQNVVISH